MNLSLISSTLYGHTTYAENNHSLESEFTFYEKSRKKSKFSLFFPSTKLQYNNKSHYHYVFHKRICWIYIYISIFFLISLRLSHSHTLFQIKRFPVSRIFQYLEIWKDRKDSRVSSIGDDGEDEDDWTWWKNDVESEEEYYNIRISQEDYKECGDSS